MHMGLNAEDIRDITARHLPWEKLNNKSILITGGNGLIASAFIEAVMLSEKTANTSITAFCRNREKAEKRFEDFSGNERFSVLAGDVCEPFISKKHFDYIIHAASPSHPLAFSNTPVDVIKANFIGTMNMLDKAVADNARLMYISSGEVYGQNRDGVDFIPETETGSINQLSTRACYPEGKRVSETLCAAYRAQYGADFVIARPCYVYGAAITDDNSRADAQFLRRALSGEDIIMKSDGMQRRTYCYVADCVAAMLFILLLGECGEAYNIADRRSILTIREYAETLAGLAGVSLRFELPPMAEKAGYSTAARAVLCGKKLEALGFTGINDIKTGLEKTISISRSLKG